jgi:hypothetical protein
MPNRLMQQYHRARVFRVAGARGRSVFVLLFRGLPEWMRAFRSSEEARKGCSFVELGSFVSSFSIFCNRGKAIFFGFSGWGLRGGFLLTELEEVA